jgi:OOP family OmpA-OmpF porin
MFNISFKSTLIAVATLAASSAAIADQNFYMGGSIGRSQTNISGSEAYRLSGPGVLTYKVYGGYKFNQYFGSELQYTRLGSGFNFRNNIDTATLGSVSRHALSLSAVGFAPLTEQFTLLGKVGVVRTIHRTSGDAITAGYGNGQTGRLLGAGAEYMMTKQLALRAEYEYMALRKPKNILEQAQFSQNLMSLGVRYQF